jgi:hypothetical protein
MLKLTLRNTDTQNYGDETVVVENYAAEGTVACAGDSIWGDTEGRVVRVDGVRVRKITYDDGDTSTMVDVEHDTTWDIYTDTGFEDAISAALGLEVTFTEQGMQDDGVASMET